MYLDRVLQRFHAPDGDPGAPAPETPPAAPPATPPASDPPAPPAAPPPATPPATPPADPPPDPPAAPPATPPADPPPGPPEKYELSAPAESGLEPADLDRIAELARAEGWTQDTAQAYTTATAKTLVAERARLKAEFDRHPELSGANAIRADEYMHRILDRFLPASTPDGARFRAELDKSGNRFNVPFRLLLANLGRAASEDPGLAGTSLAARGLSGSNVGRKSDPELFYTKTGQ